MEDSQLKLAGQVAGLEMVVKALLTMHMASQVKDEAGFSKAAQLAETMSERLQAQARSLLDQSPQETKESGAATIMLGEMVATVARCFDQPASQMHETAKVVLEISDPPTDAKN